MKKGFLVSLQYAEEEELASDNFVWVQHNLKIDLKNLHLLLTLKRFKTGPQLSRFSFGIFGNILTNLSKPYMPASGL